jgi:hypothetical protein
LSLVSVSVPSAVDFYDGDYTVADGYYYVAGNCDRGGTPRIAVLCAEEGIYRVPTTGGPLAKVADVAFTKSSTSACTVGAWLATPSVNGNDLYFSAYCRAPGSANDTVYVAAIDGSETAREVYTTTTTEIAGIAATDTGVIVCEALTESTTPRTGRASLIPREGGAARVLASDVSYRGFGLPLWKDGVAFWVGATAVYRANTR